MPATESGGTGNMWYSFDHGMAHFISLDSETEFGNGIVGPDETSLINTGPFGAYQNAQVDWLAKDLAAVDRTRTLWVIVSKCQLGLYLVIDKQETDCDSSAPPWLVRRLSWRLYIMPKSIRASLQQIQRRPRTYRPQPLLPT